MSIARTIFDEISEDDLQSLIEASVPEGLTIEYKRDPYGKSDADKKEALKDITSFANSDGGHLIIGMEETNGVPTGLKALPGEDSDALITRMESLVRDGVEPRMVGVRMRAVTLSNGGAALVIRIPRSWNPPHRVSAAKTSRFYVRNSGGVHEASVEELRVLFTLSADLFERIKIFRTDRIAKIAAGQGPVMLPGNGLLVVHLVPLAAFGNFAPIDLERAHKAHMNFQPMAPRPISMTPRFNLDGFINVIGGSECCSYTQVFRNGILEATSANVLASWQGATILHAGATTDEIVSSLPNYFEGLRLLDVPAPIVLMVSYQGVAGAKLAIHRYDHRMDKIQPFPSVDPLILPESIVDDYGSAEDCVQALRPIFDALWNAAGFVRCTYYDDEGNWQPPQ